MYADLDTKLAAKKDKASGKAITSAHAAHWKLKEDLLDSELLTTNNKINSRMEIPPRGGEGEYFKYVFQHDFSMIHTSK